MDSHELIDRLSAFINIDYGAIKQYDLIIFNIDDQDTLQKMELFRQDHEYHVRDYTDMLERIMGRAQEPMDREKDLFFEEKAVVQSGTGLRAALEALESMEKAVNAVYSGGMSEEFPDDIRDILERNCADERRHLEYIQQVLQKEAAA